MKAIECLIERMDGLENDITDNKRSIIDSEDRTKMLKEAVRKDTEELQELERAILKLEA